MEDQEIFEKARDLAKEKGKHIDDSVYIGLCSVGGDFFIYRDDYKYKKKGFTIKYSAAQFDDGSGKWEEASIFSKKGFLSPNKKAYYFLRKVREEDHIDKSSDKAWQEKFSELIQN